MIPAVGFELRWDGQSSRDFPNGYWYASTVNGDYDATGPTVEIAMANLIHVLHTRIVELELGKK